MGRIFEKRKYKMFARFDRMAKTFTRIGKDIAIAVKQGGANPDHNSRLRVAIQNAKGANMPKDRIESAIKRATSKEQKDLREMIYEGYGPHGISLIIECATDNPTRTVANVRLHLSKNGGHIEKSGSVSFLFERTGIFVFNQEEIEISEYELDLIEAGAEDIQEDEEETVIYTKYNDFGNMQKFLESKNLNVKESKLCYTPLSKKELTKSEQEHALTCIETLESDDDVQHVYHNMA